MFSGGSKEMVLGVGKDTCYQPQFDSRTYKDQGEKGSYKLSSDLHTWAGACICLPTHKHLVFYF